MAGVKAERGIAAKGPRRPAMYRDSLQPGSGHHRTVSGHAFLGDWPVLETTNEGDPPKADAEQVLSREPSAYLVVERGEREGFGPRRSGGAPASQGCRRVGQPQPLCLVDVGRRDEKPETPCSIIEAMTCACMAGVSSVFAMTVA